MAGKRKVHRAAFKAQVALVALKGDRTINELTGGVHPTLIHGWKKQLVTGAEKIFESLARTASADAEARQELIAGPGYLFKLLLPHRIGRQGSLRRPARRHPR
ncbi:transposase [Singulisphaera sp. Ch08]|uniref:Transposase n=1 Tax=Singulisphaera sp. Ch08 TaxID=3120278 RepID=A0AAU7CIU9_9BACT